MFGNAGADAIIKDIQSLKSLVDNGQLKQDFIKVKPVLEAILNLVKESYPQYAAEIDFCEQLLEKEIS